MSRDKIIEQIKKLQADFYPGRTVWDAHDKEHVVKCAYVDGNGPAYVSVFTEDTHIGAGWYLPDNLSLERPMPDGNYINVEHDKAYIYAKKDLQWYRFHPGNPTFYASEAPPKTGKLFRIEDINAIVEVTQ